MPNLKFRPNWPQSNFLAYNQATHSSVHIFSIWPGLHATNRAKRLSMRTLIITISAMMLTVIITLLALLLDSQPVVLGQGALSERETRALERLIADNTPSRFRSSDQRELSLSGSELTLLGNFTLSNIPQLAPLAVRFEITDNQGTALLSIPADIGPFTLFLNLRASFEQQAERAELISLYVGHLRIPQPLIRAGERIASQRLSSASQANQELASLRHNVQAVALAADKVFLRLTWEPEVLSQIRSQAQQVLVTGDDRERLLFYYSEIVQIATLERENRATSSLQTFMPTLFSVARQRSASEGDPIAENRALLQALSLFVNNLPLSHLVAELPDGYHTEIPDLRTSLYRRPDLSQHFVTSAAITASAGASIAEVLANSKEVYDARVRAGFSFSDMTANIAGMALGEHATRDHDSASKLQQAMIWANAETDYMPAPTDDADNLSDEEFAELFVDRNSNAYNERIQQINQRVETLPVYNY
jgi:hypothetical protein